MGKYISKHKQKRIARRKTGGLVTISVVALLAIVVLLFPQFYVKEINVNGLRKISRDEIIYTAKFDVNNHLLKGISGSFSEIVSMRHKISEDILALEFPYIKEVTVKSVFPSQILVEITERVEIAYIAVKDGFMMIDSQGVAVLTSTKDYELDIPLIEGIQITKGTLGQKVMADVPEYLNQSIVLLNDIINADKDARIDVELLSRIVSIRIVQDKIAYLKIELPESNEQIMVKVKIDQRLPSEMLWVRYAIYQGSLSNRGKGIFDLTTTQRTFSPSNE